MAGVFIGYSISIPVYLALFLLVAAWSLWRKNGAAIFGYVLATLAPLVWYGWAGREPILGSLLFTAAFFFSLREIFWKKGRVAGKGPTRSDRSRLVGSIAVLSLFLLLGARESDIIVSKLYYIPWPIYPDYTYPPGVERFDLKSVDGTKLNGWFFRGKSPEAAKRPVILYVHGNAGNMAAQMSQFEFLMDWGYDVFTFDYRGFGLSEGRPSRRGLWKDTQAAFREMATRHPGRRYAVVGFSMGASYAALLAALEPRLSSAVIIAPFPTFREIGAYTLRSWGLPLWSVPAASALLVPRDLEPREAFRRAKTPPPALFVHGTADGNVPFAMGEGLAREYRGPKTILAMPGYGHGDHFKGPLGEEFRRNLDSLLSGKKVGS
jgi:fermentation-respiration switch protein FrsA (DUF1100 family)